MIPINIKKMSKDAVMPSYANDGDSGLDLFSIEDVEIKTDCFKTINTGIIIELPKGFEAQVRSRSGLSSKYGIAVLNSPGTIDQGYRGEIKVILINHGKETFHVSKQMKIAQMVIASVCQVEITEVDFITNETERGTDGFGSTGI
jgi:dUTP pyrophosphatase